MRLIDADRLEPTLINDGCGFTISVYADEAQSWIVEDGNRIVIYNYRITQGKDGCRGKR